MSAVGPEVPRRNPVSGRIQFAGRPLPVPAWAIVIAGGGVTAALAPFVVRHLGDPASVLACTLLGAATGALAGVVLARIERRTVVFAAALGLAAGALLFLAAHVHGSLALLAAILLAGLPAATMAFALRLDRSETVTLCALALTYLAVGGCLLYFAVLAAGSILKPHPEPLQLAASAIVGALAWLKPAGVRIVKPAAPPRAR